MKQHLVIVLIISGIFFPSISRGVDVVYGTTDDGRRTVLFPDGTWVFKPSKIPKSKLDPLSTPPKAKAFLNGGNGNYVVYYDESIWKLGKKLTEGAEHTLHHKKGDGWAMLIYERIPIPLENLKNIVLQNAQDIDQEASIVHEELRNVNDTQVMVLKISATNESIHFLYYGHYVSGKWGTLQFITVTTTSLFDEFERDFTELLSGLSITP